SGPLPAAGCTLSLHDALPICVAAEGHELAIDEESLRAVDDLESDGAGAVELRRPEGDIGELRLAGPDDGPDLGGEDAVGVANAGPVHGAAARHPVARHQCREL